MRGGELLCSIGWIRLRDGYLLFKNRDRPEGEEKANYIEEDGILAFKDRSEPGIWLGVNRHGVGVATAWGPDVNVRKGLEPDNFRLLEEILRSAKGREEAEKAFLESAPELGRSYNVIIADARAATEIEYMRGRKSVHSAEDFLVKTNHFTRMEELNIPGRRLDNSRERLIFLGKEAKDAEKAEDLIPVLGHHAKERIRDVCRHEESETVATAILEVKDDVRALYCLNIPPHENRFEVKIWQMQK